MSRHGTSGRVGSVASVLEVASEWRANGARVVLASGAFDLAHAGHARAVAAARRRGDRLIVAVEDDGAAARRLGPGRPVSTGSDRARVVAALRGVDAVVLVDEAGLARLREGLGREARQVGIDAGLDSEPWSRLRGAGERR